MKKLRYLIIDDEYLARQRLLKLLEGNDSIQFVGECKNGNEAIERISIKEPDLIFLDVQMPDLNGFEVLNNIKNIPIVIFTTAYDSYALKAFEINAVDYLLKPFDEDRLKIALDRVLNLWKDKEGSLLEEKIKKLIQGYKSETTNYLSEIIITDKGRSKTIYLDDVIYFKSDGNYVNIFTEDKTYLYRIMTSKLVKEIDPSQFLRIHRSLIINKIYIKASKYLGNNEYQFVLKNGITLTSSRTYKKIIINHLT